MKARRLKTNGLKTAIETRGRKLSYEDKLQQIEAEKEIDELKVLQAAKFPYERKFRNRVAGYVCKIKGKKFTVLCPEKETIFIVTRYR